MSASFRTPRTERRIGAAPAVAQTGSATAARYVSTICETETPRRLAYCLARATTRRSTVNVSLAIYVSCHGVVRRTARDRLCGLTERLFKGTYYMITAAALIITGIATIAVVALLCIAVYDPARTAGMSLKQRAAFCLRQLSSSWPWR